MRGFFRLAIGIPELRLGNPLWNAKEILRLYQIAEAKGAAVLAVPELAITGYSCGDIFGQEVLLSSALTELEKLASQTHSTVLSCGIPFKVGHALYNAAAVLQNGEIRGFAVKEYLPDSGVFYEKRQFSPAHELPCRSVFLNGKEIPIGSDLIFNLGDSFCLGIEICEDLWAVNSPSCDMALSGAEVIANLSASNAVAGKAKFRRRLVENASSKLTAAYLYAGAGIGESTSDVVFDGQALCAVNGHVLAETQRFQQESQVTFYDFNPGWLQHLRRTNTSFRSAQASREIRRIALDGVKEVALPEYCHVGKHPYIPTDPRDRQEHFEEILDILTAGLARRMEHVHAQSMVIGVSGGLDSTLALLVCARCADRLKLPRKSVIGITMPGLATGDLSRSAAITLMDALDISQKVIPINEEVAVHLKAIGHQGAPDITMENAQARERTKILMDVANQLHGIVIGTGDLSELALGWCTYNGDQMAMYCVNSSLPKTLVKHIVEYLAETGDSSLKEVLLTIAGQPFSPELIPNAPPTEMQIGNYELHDFFLWLFLTYGATPTEILELAEFTFQGQFSKDECRKTLEIFLKRFFTQQFKRNPMPDGPKATELSLSPRGDWRMPADMNPDLWLSELKDE